MMFNLTTDEACITDGTSDTCSVLLQSLNRGGDQTNLNGSNMHPLGV